MSQKALGGPARGPHGQHGANQPGPAGQVLGACPPRRAMHPCEVSVPEVGTLEVVKGVA